MKKFLPVLFLASFAVFSRAQSYPQVDLPTSMSVSIPAEMSGHGKIDTKITLHYRTGGKHQFMDGVFAFVLLDENGDPVSSTMSVMRSQLATEVVLEGTDPEYAPRIEFNTMSGQRPFTTGARYQLLVVYQRGIFPLANVKSFKIAE